MAPNSLTVTKKGHALRIRKPRDVTSSHIQALAKAGATDGILTPREIKEICQAVVAMMQHPSAEADVGD